jgi:hypothetical protein
MEKRPQLDIMDENAIRINRQRDKRTDGQPEGMIMANDPQT